MPILSILIALVLAGVVMWIVNSLIPMDARVKTIFNVIALIALVLWLLKAFGLFSLSI